MDFTQRKNLNKLADIVFANVYGNKGLDATIASASINGRTLSNVELKQVNISTSFVQDKLTEAFKNM